MLLVLLIRRRLLRMQSGDGIYRGGKLLGIRLFISSSTEGRRAMALFERSEKSGGSILGSLCAWREER